MARDIPILINGRSYGWSDIRINILGVRSIGITDINYSEKQDKKNHYGAGNEAISRGYGNKECSGDITLTMEEVESLKSAVASGNLNDIPPFDIIVCYIPAGGKVVTEKLIGCEFTEMNKAAKQGDTSLESKLPLVIGTIIWK